MRFSAPLPSPQLQDHAIASCPRCCCCSHRLSCSICPSTVTQLQMLLPRLCSERAPAACHCNENDAERSETRSWGGISTKSRRSNCANEAEKAKFMSHTLLSHDDHPSAPICRERSQTAPANNQRISIQPQRRNRSKRKNCTSEQIAHRAFESFT